MRGFFAENRPIRRQPGQTVHDDTMGSEIRLRERRAVRLVLDGRVDLVIDRHDRLASLTSEIDDMREQPAEPAFRLDINHVAPQLIVVSRVGSGSNASRMRSTHCSALFANVYSRTSGDSGGS